MLIFLCKIVKKRECDRKTGGRDKWKNDGMGRKMRGKEEIVTFFMLQMACFWRQNHQFLHKLLDLSNNLCYNSHYCGFLAVLCYALLGPDNFEMKGQCRYA